MTDLQLEPARIESLLEHAWRLISQLRQWFAAWSLGSKDHDGLVELIRNLQLLWIKADDLELKQLARNSLAIEQFLERFCAGKLKLTSDNLNDVTAAVATLQDLLLGLEAMREEPVITDLASLQKLERDTLKGFWSDAANRTIEVPMPATDVTRGTATTELRVSRRDVIPSQSHPRSMSETGLNGLKPFSGATVSERIDLCASAASRHWPLAMGRVLSVRENRDASDLIRISDVAILDARPDAAIESAFADVPERWQEAIELRRVLIVEDSLFYRNLIGMALRSVGYDSDSISPDANAFQTIQNERTTDYCAILVGQPVTPEFADAIVRFRDAKELIVIALMSSDGEESFPFTVDGSVSKSNPRQLIVLLNHLLNPVSNVASLCLETDFDPSSSARDANRRVG